MIWTTPVDLETINKLMRNTLVDHLGIEFIEVGDDHLTASMPVDARSCTLMGILHGGASCALAETVGSIAANFCVDPSQKVCLGLDINANHLRPVHVGSLLKAVAKPLHLGNTTQVWEIKIYSDTKKLVSISRLTMAVVSKESVSRGKVSKDRER